MKNDFSITSITPTKLKMKTPNATQWDRESEWERGRERGLNTRVMTRSGHENVIVESQYNMEEKACVYMYGYVYVCLYVWVQLLNKILKVNHNTQFKQLRQVKQGLALTLSKTT